MVGIHSGRNRVKAKRLTDAPGDIVVGTRGIATDAESSDDVPAGVECKSTAEHIDAADTRPDHWIVSLAVPCRITTIGDGKIDGIALLQTEQTPAGHDRRIEITGTQRE